jgi:drug/metabolite transporter (DMT)-like permease
LSTDTSQENTPVQLKSWVILIALGLTWGSSFILIKKGLEVYAPTQVACLRLSISALTFLPFLLGRWSKVDWSKWKPLLVVGLCGSLIPAFMFSIAQTQISSSMAGILNSLTPLFTLVLGVLIFGNTGHWRKYAGVLIGLAGASMLILMGKNAGIDGNLWYGLLVVVAAMCYGISSNTVGSYLKDMRSLTISSVAFTTVGFPALVYLVAGTDFLFVLGNEPGAWTALGYIAILAIFGTVIATVFFFMLVQWTSALFSSMVTYLIPIIALLWGVLDGEVISIYHFLGMGLILSGIYLSRQRKKKLKPAMQG